MLALVLLSALAHTGAGHHELMDVRGPLWLPEPRNDSSAAAVPRLRDVDGRVELKLCECERATGAPYGLSCDKEGWFVSGFERQGQWVAGGGYVPLSHAICCRPCLPAELPPDPSGRIPSGQAPLAVFSLACHASTDELLSRCEQGPTAGSFVSGFSEAIKVFSTPDTFYPVNTAQCCTPALLLPNGDAWELERCGCHDSGDPQYPVNCGGTTTDELLMGYLFYRLSPLGHVVPVGPAQCCKVCLGSTVHPMNQCEDLQGCHQHGVCNLGQCECFDGWGGADCSARAGRGGGIPGWAVALIVLSSCAVAGMLMAALGALVQAVAAHYAASEEGDEEGRQPLLLRIDADDTGSVGSADTDAGSCAEGEEGELGAVEARVSAAIDRLENGAGGAGERGAGGAAERTERAEHSAGGAELGGVCEGDDAEGPAGQPRSDGAVGPAGGADAAEPDVEAGRGGGRPRRDSAATEATGGAPARQAAAVGDVEIAEPTKSWYGGGEAVGPLAMVDCIVCMTRPVQDIARRQRLFV
eukprot:scaffold4.g4577.t1